MSVLGIRWYNLFILMIPNRIQLLSPQFVIFTVSLATGITGGIRGRRGCGWDQVFIHSYWLDRTREEEDLSPLNGMEILQYSPRIMVPCECYLGFSIGDSCREGGGDWW